MALLNPVKKEEIDIQINLAFNKINKDYRILIETGVKLGKVLKSLDRPDSQREFVYMSK